MATRPTRRAALALLGSTASGAALALAASSPAAAQLGPSLFGGRPALPPDLRFGSIAVDTDHVAFLGYQAGAELLARDLPGQLRAVFADRMAPRGAGGASLTARISSLYLASYTGGHTGGVPQEGSDNIEGVGIVSSGGRVLSETPIYTVLDPAYSGPWYLPNIDELRIASISHQFAWWLRREMGI